MVKYALKSNCTIFQKNSLWQIPPKPFAEYHKNIPTIIKDTFLLTNHTYVHIVYIAPWQNEPTLDK